jgi:hypothetical protein
MNRRLVFIVCEVLWLFAQASYGSNLHVSRAEVATYIFTSILD